MTTRKRASPFDLEDELDRDILSLPLDEVDDELVARGVDPDRVARWGAAVARQRRDEQRLAWQSAARRRLERAWSHRLAVDLTQLPDDRAQLLSIVERMRTSMGAPAEIAFRKRSPETAETDELKQLIEELLLLETLPDDEP